MGMILEHLEDWRLRNQNRKTVFQSDLLEGGSESGKVLFGSNFLSIFSRSICIVVFPSLQSRCVLKGQSVLHVGFWTISCLSKSYSTVLHRVLM